MICSRSVGAVIFGEGRGISAEYPSLARCVEIPEEFLAQKIPRIFLCQRTLPLDAEIVKNILLAYLSEKGFVDEFNRKKGVQR